MSVIEASLEVSIERELQKEKRYHHRDGVVLTFFGVLYPVGSNHGAVMTQKTSVERDLVFIRDTVQYDADNPESRIESAVPFWTLVDRERNEVLARSSAGAMFKFVTHQLQLGRIPPYSRVEYLYSTSVGVEDDQIPTAVNVHIRDFLTFLETVDEGLTIARQLKREEDSNRQAAQERMN